MHLIDSNIWIAAKIEKDYWHKKGKEIVKKILDGALKKVVITDYIVDEVVTYLNARTNFETAREMLETLTSSQFIEVIIIDAQQFEKTKEIFEKNKNLSFTDASSVVVMQDKKINKIISFDEDFDGIEGIERVKSILYLKP